MTAVTGWTAVSAYGLDTAAFAAGVTAGGAAPGGAIAGFDLREVLGTAGTRSMDRITGLAVHAANGLLPGGAVGGAADGAVDGPVGARTGTVLGVGSGSLQSMVELTRDSLEKSRAKGRPEMVKPAQFPNTLMNAAAAQIAIRHHLTGPNATLAAGRTAGLVALRYATRLRGAGRTGAVVVGAADELTPARERLENQDGPRGEGAALLLLGDGPGLADVLGCASGVFPNPERASAVLDRCVGRLVGDEDPWVHVHAHDPALPEPELPAAGEPEHSRSIPELLGDTGAVSGAFALVAALALAADDSASAGRTALVTATDRDGTVGAVLLRLT